MQIKNFLQKTYSTLQNLQATHHFFMLCFPGARLSCIFKLLMSNSSPGFLTFFHKRSRWTVSESHVIKKYQNSKDLAQDLRCTFVPSADPSTEASPEIINASVAVKKKPFLSKGNRKTRLRYAKLNKIWTEDQWQQCASSVCMSGVRRKVQQWVSTTICKKRGAAL